MTKQEGAASRLRPLQGGFTMEKDQTMPQPLRKNEGYTIIKAVTVEDTEIVLGKMETHFNTMYVTWRCDGGSYYYWGHYFTDPHAAERDMYQRAVEVIEINHPDLVKDQQTKDKGDRDER